MSQGGHSKPLHILYLLSQYPVLTETFIAREMRQLALQGNKLTIGTLRKTDVVPTDAVIAIPSSQIISASFQLWGLIRALGWGVRHNPAKTVSALREVLVLVFRPREFIKALGILVLALHLARSLTLQGQRPDHIRAHFLFSASLAAMWLARFLDAPFSITCHTTEIQLPTSLIHHAVREATFVAAITNETRQFVRGIRGDEENVYIIRNGIDLTQFSYEHDPDREGVPLILGVGSLRDKKGFDSLIQACALLQQQGLPFNCEIIGDGPERAALEALLAHLNLTEAVHLAGSKPFSEVLQAFRKATLFVMPSRRPQRSTRDGLPTVIIEAMAAGVPVIATDFAGIPDLVIHEETGLLVPPEDFQALADAMKRIIEDAELGVKLAQGGRLRVGQKFDVQQTIRELEELIRKDINLS